APRFVRDSHQIDRLYDRHQGPLSAEGTGTYELYFEASSRRRSHRANASPYGRWNMLRPKISPFAPASKPIRAFSMIASSLSLPPPEIKIGVRGAYEIACLAASTPARSSVSYGA